MSDLSVEVAIIRAVVEGLEKRVVVSRVCFRAKGLECYLDVDFLPRISEMVTIPQRDGVWKVYAVEWHPIEKGSTRLVPTVWMARP